MQAPPEVRLEPRRKAPDTAKPSEPESAQPQSGLAAMLNDSPRQVQLRAQTERLTAGRAARPIPAPIQPRAGAPLPAPLQAGAEALSGLSLDDVRVHYDSPEPERLGALAFAQGSDVHLGPGQERHLPHEAWHVVQQAQGRVPPTLQAKSGIAINDDGGLEREADIMGERALDASVAAPAALEELRPGYRVLQGKFAVQVVMADLEIADEVGEGELETSHQERRISQVHLAGRPEGLFKNAEKCHTTAWAAFTDQIRNAVLGRTVEDAVGAVDDLCEDSKNLPGAARAPNLAADTQVRYRDAEKAMDDLNAIDVDSMPNEKRLEHLQNLIRAYLAFRNLIPLSQVDLGKATGHGEPAILDTLRPANDAAGWEEDPDDTDSLRMPEPMKAPTRQAMWDLFDKQAVAHFLVGPPTAATTPGLGEGEADPAALIADAVTQHLWTMKSTYQSAFEPCGMESEDSIRNFLASAGCVGPVQDGVFAQIGTLAGSAQPQKSQANADRYAAEGHAGQAMFAVQVETADDEDKVTQIQIGGRAPTLLKSAQGSHSTAWLVYVDAVRRAAIGKPVAEAMAAVSALCDSLKDLPGMARVVNLDDEQQVTHLAAIASMEGAQLAGANEARPILGLQTLIKTYLTARNVVPLSQNLKGLANANSEALYRATLLGMEDGQVGEAEDQGPYIKAFWELYDYKAVEQVREPVDAPGIAADEEEVPILGDSLRQHLMTMKQAYPISFARLDAGSDASIGYVFAKWACNGEIRQGVLDRIRNPGAARLAGSHAQPDLAAASSSSGSAATLAGESARSSERTGAERYLGFEERKDQDRERKDEREEDRDRDRQRDRARYGDRDQDEEREQDMTRGREKKTANKSSKREEEMARGGEKKAANKSKKREDSDDEWEG